jgi:hypothetical protein
VRCLARSPEKLAAREWSEDPGVEVRRSDLGDCSSLAKDLAGREAAFYLVHSIQYEHDRRRSLRAEMKVPGEALLEFRIEPRGASECTLQQGGALSPPRAFRPAVLVRGRSPASHRLSWHAAWHSARGSPQSKN